VSKYNEFNRRTFEEESAIKSSLYFKHLRKCKGNVYKRDMETAFQSAIVKKKINTKSMKDQEGPLFWECFK
jgi:hypothetical protein